MKRKLTWIWIAALALAWSGTALAQDSEDEVLYGSGAAFARLVAVEGSVTINRESEDDLAGVANLSIEPLDTLTTQRGGRAVVQFLDGSLVKLSEGSRIDFLEIGNMEDVAQLSLLARMWEGAIFLDISDEDTFDGRSFRVDTADATLYFLSSGRYRIDKRSGETVLKVISGTAEVRNVHGSTLYHAGEQAFAQAGRTAISKSYFNTFEMDAFDMWAMNNYNRRASESAAYVPAELKHYASDLDGNGTWHYDDSLTTHVWRPNVVVADWNPYSNGYWAYSPYGMSWVSYYSWGWAPFHYGAWDWSISFGWVWVPGRHYSPAWVSWCYWDSYMGWYPYNHHHWRHYHRGRVDRYHHRHRVVYTRSDRLHYRNNRWATRDMPEGRHVTRVDRPIAPSRDKLVRAPREAIREAVNRPVTRDVVRKRETVVREQTSTRINRDTTTRSGERGSRISSESSTIRTPVIRKREPGASGGRTDTPIQNRTITPRSESRSSGSVSSAGKVIRRNPVVRSERNSTTQGSSSTVIRRSTGTTASRATVRPTTTTSRPVAVTPRSSTTRPTVGSTSSSRNRTPVVTSRKTTVTPQRSTTTTRSRTVTTTSKTTSRRAVTPSKSSSRSTSSRSTSSRSTKTNTNRKR